MQKSAVGYKRFVRFVPVHTKISGVSYNKFKPGIMKGKRMEVMPTISLCMIVRNEENNIRRCLESAARFVDEIVIADTGSTDQTKRICREFGVRLFDFKWTNDFAKVRNFCLEKTLCNWILWLDADEELQMRDFSALQSCLQDKRDDFLAVRMLHFYGHGPADEKRSYTSSAFRLFRNGAGIRYTGKIHEQLTPGTASTIPHMEPNRYMRILHYGYMENALNSKTGRNIGLLLEEKEKQPDNAWLDYHLAAEYYRLKEYIKAFQYVNTAIVRFLGKGVFPPSLAYRLKYDILITTGSFQKASWGIEKAIALYPDYVDLYFFKGMMQLALENYEKAEQTFAYCLVLGETNPEYMILSGTGSFSALYQLGLCYEKQAKYEQANEAYSQALALYKDFEAAKKRLSGL